MFRAYTFKLVRVKLQYFRLLSLILPQRCEQKDKCKALSRNASLHRALLSVQDTAYAAQKSAIHVPKSAEMNPCPVALHGEGALGSAMALQVAPPHQTQRQGIFK